MLTHAYLPSILQPKNGVLSCSRHFISSIGFGIVVSILYTGHLDNILAMSSIYEATQNAPTEHLASFAFHNVPKYCINILIITNRTQGKIHSPIVPAQYEMPEIFC